MYVHIYLEIKEPQSPKTTDKQIITKYTFSTDVFSNMCIDVKTIKFVSFQDNYSNKKKPATRNYLTLPA